MKLTFQDFEAPFIQGMCWTCKYGSKFGLDLAPTNDTNDLMAYLEACRQHLRKYPDHSVELQIDGRFNLIEE